MSLADFQNPLANMPIMQQWQQVQSHSAQSTPQYVQNDFDKNRNTELTTVQETEEQEKKDPIREEDEDRGAKQQAASRRRTAPAGEESKEKTRPNDGIHGRFLDIQA
ncbi:MAG: hypothetical protein RBU29_16075 [bacterium]|jgi:hypothetical protein|nr:hypothetical protein [bacterium]